MEKETFFQKYKLYLIGAAGLLVVVAIMVFAMGGSASVGSMSVSGSGNTMTNDMSKRVDVKTEVDNSVSKTENHTEDADNRSADKQINVDEVNANGDNGTVNFSQ